MRPLPFETVSSLMNKLDIMLLMEHITYEQWVDAYSIFVSLGWEEEEFLAEIDVRWTTKTVAQILS